MTAYSQSQARVYQAAKCAAFLRTKEQWGGFSNMAAGYPLVLNGVSIWTSEALYQTMRFPHLPELQRLIIDQKSPMSAKMVCETHIKDSRPDWDKVKVAVMRWCLHLKLVQNWQKFTELLWATEDRPIVEKSFKDSFWGAKPQEDGTMVGINALGRLLMELREQLRSNDWDLLQYVSPPKVPDFLLYEKAIGQVVQ